MSVNHLAIPQKKAYLCLINSGTSVRAVGKKVLILLLYIIFTWHYAQESCKLGREIIGIEKEMPMGNNEKDKNKTLWIMRKTITDYNNYASGAIPQTSDKNPVQPLL